LRVLIVFYKRFVELWVRRGNCLWKVGSIITNRNTILP
jgi:hypothetical protein